jgi:SpoVK/Ycf46/Vps4 family AAA+-type ATPase
VAKIEEQLLSNRTIFLNLSLKERAIGLDDIVKDLSSFFDLPINFWNLSKSTASKVIFRENTVTNHKYLGDYIDKDLEHSPTANRNISSLTKRLQDQKTLTSSPTKTYTAQSFEDIITTLTNVSKRSDRGIFIIENINQLISSKTLDVFQFEQIKTWMIRLTQKSRREKDFYLIILGSSNSEWQFEDIAPTVRLPYLSADEVADLLKEKFAKLKLKDSDKNHLTDKAKHILTGMTAPELNWGIENITNSLKNNNSVQNYIDGLLEYKQKKLKDLGLSFLPPPEINEVGGMDILKQYIDNLEIEFAADQQKYNIPRPQGYVLVGVPGAGKSLVAKVLQQRLAMPMIHIPVEKIKDLGASYLARILELCEANAPNIVYIDELDKVFPGKDLEGKSATTLGVFLTWLQEKQAQCFVLATLNRLDTLPPELIRSGRFSEIFYVGFPQPIERKKIFQIYLKKYDSRYEKNILTDIQWRELIDESIKYTGSEIAAVVEKSYKTKFIERIKARRKLEAQLYEYLEALIPFIQSGYSKQVRETPPSSRIPKGLAPYVASPLRIWNDGASSDFVKHQINFSNLDAEINKIMQELPQLAEQIDELYGQLLEAKETDNLYSQEISQLNKNLNQIINQGYSAIAQEKSLRIINLDNLDAIVSQAMVDLPEQAEKIDQMYYFLTKIQEAITKLDTKPLVIDYETLLDFTIQEIPLFERNVEKVMAIENRARKFCKPVSSKDTSNLIEKEPTFWPEMKPKEVLQIVNFIRGKEAQQDEVEYQPKEKIEEVFNPQSDEYQAENYWAF